MKQKNLVTKFHCLLLLDVELQSKHKNKVCKTETSEVQCEKDRSKLLVTFEVNLHFCLSSELAVSKPRQQLR